MEKVVQNLCLKGLQNSNCRQHITSPHLQVLLFCFQFPLSLFFVLDARHPDDSTKITTDCCEKLTGGTLIKDATTKVTLLRSLPTFPSFSNLFLSSADFRLYSAAILNATAPIACLISKPNCKEKKWMSGTLSEFLYIWSEDWFYSSVKVKVFFTFFHGTFSTARWRVWLSFCRKTSI